MAYSINNPWGWLDLWSRSQSARSPFGAPNPRVGPSFAFQPPTAPTLGQYRNLLPPQFSPPSIGQPFAQANGQRELFNPTTAPSPTARVRQVAPPRVPNGGVEPWNPVLPPPMDGGVPKRRVPRTPQPPNAGDGSANSGRNAPTGYAGQPKPQTTPQSAATPAVPNMGNVYYPKPDPWVTQSSAYLPLRFPGVESSAGGRTYYQDGSNVDYNSASWKRASAYTPTEHADLWQALPDSWKAEMAGWDKVFVDQYLSAMSRYNQAGEFGGQRMSGAEAAKQIVQMAREAKLKQQEAAAAQARPVFADTQQRFSPALPRT